MNQKACLKVSEKWLKWYSFKKYMNYMRTLRLLLTLEISSIINRYRVLAIYTDRLIPRLRRLNLRLKIDVSSFQIILQSYRKSLLEMEKYSTESRIIPLIILDRLKVRKTKILSKSIKNGKINMSLLSLKKSP